LVGPAVISQFNSTTLVLSDWTGEVHRSGAILLTMTGSGRRQFHF
jgi:hypothetical protein